MSNTCIINPDNPEGDRICGQSPEEEEEEKGYCSNINCNDYTKTGENPGNESKCKLDPRCEWNSDENICAEKEERSDIISESMIKPAHPFYPFTEDLCESSPYTSEFCRLNNIYSFTNHDRYNFSENIEIQNRAVLTNNNLDVLSSNTNIISKTNDALEQWNDSVVEWPDYLPKDNTLYYINSNIWPYYWMNDPANLAGSILQRPDMWDGDGFVFEPVTYPTPDRGGGIDSSRPWVANTGAHTGRWDRELNDTYPEGRDWSIFVNKSLNKNLIESQIKRNRCQLSDQSFYQYYPSLLSQSAEPTAPISINERWDNEPQIYNTGYQVGTSEENYWNLVDLQGRIPGMEQGGSIPGV